MEPMKTCGNCWWWKMTVYPSGACQHPLPIPIWALELMGVSKVVNIDHDATDCPCWRKRWVEAHKHTEGGEL